MALMNSVFMLLRMTHYAFKTAGNGKGLTKTPYSLIPKTLTLARLMNTNIELLIKIQSWILMQKYLSDCRNARRFCGSWSNTLFAADLASINIILSNKSLHPSLI